MKYQESKFRGNNIYFDGLVYRYSDTDEETISCWKDKGCGHCGLKDIKEGYQAYDGCLGKLDSTIVMNACCGHGVIKNAYLQFCDGSVINGQIACDRIEEIKKN